MLSTIYTRWIRGIVRKYFRAMILLVSALVSRGERTSPMATIDTMERTEVSRAVLTL